MARRAGRRSSLAKVDQHGRDCVHLRDDATEAAADWTGSAALYERVLVWLAWAHGLVDPIKLRIRAYLRLFSPRRAGRTMRLFWRIRRRIRSQAV